MTDRFPPYGKVPWQPGAQPAPPSVPRSLGPGWLVAGPSLTDLPVLALAVVIVVLLAGGLVGAAGAGRSSTPKRPGSGAAAAQPSGRGAGAGAPSTTSTSSPSTPSGVAPVSPLSVPPVSAPPVSTRPASLSPSAISALVDRDVVDIDTRLAYQHAIAAGTGMILTSSGIILTNNHVIDGATTIGAVSIGNGRTYQATVIGVDPTADVALLQLQGASNLPTVSISNLSPNPGDPVVALGNAGGAGGAPSVSSGTVVALGQSIIAADPGEGTSEQLNGLIESTAGLQPGDSGGPLVDGRGQIIGMDTAASQPNQSAASLSFAIPIQQALTVVRQIEAGHASDTVFLGLPAFLGVSVSAGTGPQGQAGVLVNQMVPGGPAALAGIKAGDLITSVGGTPIAATDTLTTTLRRFRPGDTVAVSWLDPFGASHHASVVLAIGPAD